MQQPLENVDPATLASTINNELYLPTCSPGGVFVQERVPVDPDVKAPELTASLFALGSRLLLKHMPHIICGDVARVCTPQDHAQATYAHKVLGLVSVCLCFCIRHVAWIEIDSCTRIVGKAAACC